MAYRAPRVLTARLTRDVAADVLVVGMGISGAMAAEALTAERLSVIMIDRRGPLRGSTPATTALVQFEIDTPLTGLGGMLGAEVAARAWARSRLAVAALKARIETLGIACDLAERASLYLAGNLLTGAALRAEAEARRAIGLHADYLTAAPLREAWGIEREGAIVSRGNLALDPRKLTARLLLAALARGARAYAPAEAVAFEAGRSGVAVATAGGPVISVGHVVLATGYELAGPAPGKGHEVISTWAMATRRQRRRLWPGEAFMWEASEPYLYLRATPDGRVICGGEDEPFEDEARRDAAIPDKVARISAKLSRLLPGIDATPEFAWAGAFGTTTTGLPRIGPVPASPRLFAVMGYGGNGVTFSRLAAELAVAWATGREDRDAGLFAFPD